MDLEFQTPGRTRVSAIVRNRTGYCFGLEFLTPLGSEAPKASVQVRPSRSAESGDLRSVLRRKEIEMERLRKEISTLRAYGKFTR
jgi:hypothetical protein